MQITARFTVDKPGTYYIGFHSKNPQKKDRYRGVHLYDFKVNKDNGTTKAPGDPTDIVVNAAPNGELAFEISATLPKTDLTGAPLPADKEIKLKAKTDADEKTVSGLPGTKVNLRVEVGLDAINNVAISTLSDEGEGLTHYFSSFVGIDSPLAPKNVVGVIGADNCTVDLSWDPVGDVGYNGGFVDVSEVVYDIYTYANLTDVKVGSAKKDTKYTYSISKNAPQSMVYLTPVADNGMGHSINGTYFYDLLGKPYQTPAVEEFGNQSFSFIWSYNTQAPFNGVIFEPVTDPTGRGYGSNFSFGVIGGMASSGTGQGELRAPKITTLDINRVKSVIRYWDYPKASKMEIWGRHCDNQQFRKLGELEPARNAEGSWQEWELPLPEDFAQKGWVQINFRVDAKPGESTLIDNYQILQDADYDLQVSEISGPSGRAFIGEDTKFNVVVTNSGDERNSGELTVELLGDDNVLESVTENISNLPTGEKYEFTATFPMKESYVKYEFMDVRASIKAVEDQNIKNDEMTLAFDLADSDMPVVRDLAAKRLDNGQDVQLSWSAPDNSRSNIESFETYEAFAVKDKIGAFKNVDIDGKAPFVLGVESMRWKDDDKPCAWTVINAEALNTLDYAYFSPRSGKRMLLGRSVGYDMDSGEAPTRSGDFLISPEIVGGTDVTFHMHVLDNEYTETIQVWYSTTDDNVNAADYPTDDQNTAPRECGSFKWLKNFSVKAEADWIKCTATLPADAKYFAIVYGSFGQFGAVIDDIEFTPAQPQKLDIIGYDIYRAYGDGEPEIVVPDVTDTKYIHKPGNDMAATYYVVSVAQDNSEYFYSPLSNPAFVDGSGINELGAGQSILGAKGYVIVSGGNALPFTLSDLQGRVLVNTVLTADVQKVPCEAGIYMAKLGEATVKIIVR